jgi:broad specificity phosphatase PhoE
VRHTAVAHRWRGRCYGASDAGLSRAGTADAATLIAGLAAWQPDAVVHSGMRRAAALGDPIACRLALEPIIDANWRERDFGDWEARRWTAIFRATGAAMDGMTDAPDSFRPGGGETTGELAARVVAAFGALPAGRTLVVAHGGSIAAVRGVAAGVPPRDWLALVPGHGEALEVPRNLLLRYAGAPSPTWQSNGAGA